MADFRCISYYDPVQERVIPIHFDVDQAGELIKLISEASCGTYASFDEPAAEEPADAPAPKKGKK